MAKTFIKFKPITAWSERHNQRLIKPKYLVSGCEENIAIVEENVADRLAKLQRIVKEKTNRSMQKKATPIKEAVILLPDNDNENNIELLNLFNDELKRRYGIKAFQTYIHNDEGHYEDDGEIRYNLHAHVVYDWIDERTGKSFRLNKQDMSDIQDLLSTYLGMERGQKGAKNLSLTHHEFRGYMHICDKVKERLMRELTLEEKYDIRKDIVEDRRKNQVKL